MKRHTVVLEKAGDRAQPGRGLVQRDFRGVRTDVRGERETAKGIKPRVRHGRDVTGAFVDEECVGVEDRAEARLVQPRHDPAPAFPSFRPFRPIQLEIAESKESSAAMVIDLRESEASRHCDPLRDIRLGERAEVEQVRAVIERDIARPGTTDLAKRHLVRLGQDLLKG